MNSCAKRRFNKQKIDKLPLREYRITETDYRLTKEEIVNLNYEGTIETIKLIIELRKMGIDETGDHQSAGGVNSGIDVTVVSLADKNDFVVLENDDAGLQDAMMISVPGNKRSILNQCMHVVSSLLAGQEASDPWRRTGHLLG